MIATFLLTILGASSKVFFVPHSHIDVGWIHQVNYYYSEHCSQILSTIIQLLEEDPRRRFAWSESFWLSEYLKENPDSKPKLSKLIHDGRIEIVGGGWVQHDEALTDFESVSRQIEEGHSFLKREFNLTGLKVAWQLDPFGHSSLTPALLEKFGFQFLVMARLDGTYKNQLIDNGDLEFLWKSGAFGAESGIFTHVLYNHYSLPEFLDMRQFSRCFRSLENIKKDVYFCLIALHMYVQIVKTAYRTENIMILFGDDLFFKDLNIARKQFELIEMMRDVSDDLEIQFATPSEYFSAVLNDFQKFSVFEGDFLPYVSEHLRQRPIAWTGFYSSRPALKKETFEAQALSRAAELASTLVLHRKLDTQQVSVMMHHDAITGTCAPKTSDDYLLRIQYDKNISISVINLAYSHLQTCRSEPLQLIIPYKIYLLFNSLNWNTVKLFKFPVSNPTVKLTNSNGDCLESQTIETNGQLEVIINLELEGLSFSTVFISEVSYICECCSQFSEVVETENLSNDFFNISFLFGFLDSITYNGKIIIIESILMRYDASHGGAYEFRPRNKPKGIADFLSFSVQSGPVVHFIHSKFNCSGEPCEQIVLLPVKGFYFILKFDLKAKSGDEIFLRFHNWNKNIESVYTFNTADIIKRSRFDKRKNCFGENGYPVVGGLFIDYGSVFMHIYPKFPLGVQLPKNDYFELHLHRNPQNDDVLGLGYPLEDNLFAQHEFFFTFGELNATKIWQNYLNHKNSPLEFAVFNKTTLKSNLSQGDERFEDWDFETFYKIGENHDCCYLSRMFYKDSQVFASILNICGKGQNFQLNHSVILEEVLMNGNEIEENLLEVENDGLIKFDINKNTRDSLLRYYKHKDLKRTLIPSFNLKTFKVWHDTSAKHSPVHKKKLRPTSSYQIEEINDMTLIFYLVISLLCISSLLLLLLLISKPTT